MPILSRFKIPVRAAHMLTNARALDFRDYIKEKYGLDIPDEEVLVSRHLVRNQKKKADEEAVKNHVHLNKGLKCIKFDGRKDRDSKGENGRLYTEEHISIISEPNGQYIDFISPFNTKAATMETEEEQKTGVGNHGDTVEPISRERTNTKVLSRAMMLAAALVRSLDIVAC